MPVSFTSHQAASLHECLSSQIWQGLHSPSRAGVYWSLLDPPGCLLEQNSLWHWEGCQVCEEWHQVCTSTSAWPPRNCSPDYLVLPSAWSGQVVINQAEGLVDKELIFGSFQSFHGSGFVQVAGHKLAFLISGPGKLLVQTWLQSVPFAFNPLHFHADPFEQWCLNELCPSVAL